MSRNTSIRHLNQITRKHKRSVSRRKALPAPKTKPDIGGAVGRSDVGTQISA